MPCLFPFINLLLYERCRTFYVKNSVFMGDFKCSLQARNIQTNLHMPGLRWDSGPHPRLLLVPRPRLQWRFSPPTLAASRSYGSDDAFRFWHGICSNTGHDHAVRCKGRFQYDPRALPQPPGEGARSRDGAGCSSALVVPMPTYTLLHQPELCLSLLTTVIEMQGCTRV